MKEDIMKIVNSYLEIFSSEKSRLSRLLEFLNNSLENQITDWNNVNGHITVGAFIYCQKEDKFLVLYHKDLKMFLYPGGHIDSCDNSLLDAAYREVYEECGIRNLKLFDLCSEGIPIDIDTHMIPDNPRVGMAAHYHFDFRYLYYVDNLDCIDFDKEEISSYKWVSSKELLNDENFGSIVKKIINVIGKETI